MGDNPYPIETENNTYSTITEIIVASENEPKPVTSLKPVEGCMLTHPDGTTTILSVTRYRPSIDYGLKDPYSDSDEECLYIFGNKFELLETKMDDSWVIHSLEDGKIFIIPKNIRDQLYDYFHDHRR